jgi:hypothetical protein
MPQVYDQIIPAAERFQKARDLILHCLGKSTLGRHELDEMGKPALDIVPPLGLAVLKALA